MEICKTGAEHIKSLHDGRAVYIDGEVKSIDIADDCSSERTTEKPCSTSSVGTHERNP